MEEIEVKFLAIDVAALEKKLTELGAERKFDRLYRREVYDYPDLRLNADSAWIRVRDEGDRVTMGYKQRQGISTHDGSTNDSSMHEVEIVVSSFEQATLFLRKIGMKRKFYEENRRIRWILDNVELDIDHWPQLEPYLEIEAPTWERIDAVITQLGLDPAEKKIFSTHQIYQLAGINEHDYDEITFDRMVKKNPVT